eukprot:COSAG02_NODE_1929_length_10336_cov_69.703819_5_plen_133_part_00
MYVVYVCALVTAIRRFCVGNDQSESYTPVHSSTASLQVQGTEGGVGGTSGELVADRADNQELLSGPGPESHLARQSTIYSTELTRTYTMSDAAGSGGAQPQKPSCVPNSLARAGGCRRTPHEPQVDAERAHM